MFKIRFNITCSESCCLINEELLNSESYEQEASPTFGEEGIEIVARGEKYRCRIFKLGNSYLFWHNFLEHPYPTAIQTLSRRVTFRRCGQVTPIQCWDPRIKLYIQVFKGFSLSAPRMRVGEARSHNFRFCFRLACVTEPKGDNFSITSDS